VVVGAVVSNALLLHPVQSETMTRIAAARNFMCEPL
jgi:hypothetical protein